MQPKLILHGGAGRAMRDIERKREVREALRHIAQVTYNRLLQGTPAIEAVIHGCLLLEDDPHFNAGTGSAIQQDGQVRLSASVMDGTRQSFSGVINAMRVRNPIRMAAHLQNFPDRILSDTGCHDLARELQLPLYDALTEKRLSEWFKERARNFQSDIADVVSEDQNPEEARDEAKKPTTTSESEEAALTDKGHGTIGVVALDSNGHLAVGTSTGGRGFERPGRVSDSATPSGNYATADAAVSCTGIGEHIFDESLAPRIVVRVTDGAQLSEAMQRSMNEAHARNRFFAAIGITKDGEIGWGKTTDILLAAFCDGNSTGDTLDLPPGLVASVRGT